MYHAHATRTCTSVTHYVLHAIRTSAEFESADAQKIAAAEA